MVEPTSARAQRRGILFGTLKPPGRHRKHSHPDRELRYFDDWNQDNSPLREMRLLVQHLDSGGDPPESFSPVLCGMHGPDFAEHDALQGRLLTHGYTIQRHGLESHGYAGFKPLYLWKGK